MDEMDIWPVVIQMISWVRLPPSPQNTFKNAAVYSRKKGRLSIDIHPIWKVKDPSKKYPHVWFHCCLEPPFFFAQSSTIDYQWIGLREIYRKAPYVMGKLMVSCRFSLKPIHWDNINSNHPPQALPPTVKHFKDTQGCCLTFPLVPTPFLQIKSHCWWLNHHDIPFFMA